MRRTAPQALALVSFLFWMSLYLYVPLVPGHSRSVGAGAAWVGFIAGSYGLAQLVFRIPIGMWSDRLGRRRPFVLAGCALAAASAVGFASAGSPLALLVSRFIGGAAASSYLAFMVLYASYFPKTPAAAVVRLQAITNLGVVFGITIGPWMASAAGTTTVFWIAAGSGVAALLVSVVRTIEPPPVRRPVDRPRPKLRDLLGDHTLVRVSLLAAIIQYVSHGAWFVFVFDWAEQNLAASRSDLALLALFSGVPAAAASWGAGRWLARRFGAPAVIITGFALAAVAVALVPVAPSLGALLAIQAVGGVSRGFTISLLMSLALVSVPEERRAGAVGFFQATYSIGLTLGPVATGAIGSAVGLTGGFWVMAALAGAGGIAAVLVLPRDGTFA